MENSDAGTGIQKRIAKQLETTMFHVCYSDYAAVILLEQTIWIRLHDDR